MAPSQAALFQEHGDMVTHKVLLDQLEARVRSGRDGYFLNAEGWYGGDIDKLWLKTEVEGDIGGKLEQAEFQALWSHAIDPWFDLQAGVRLDAEPDMRGHLVLGVEGLAPYWIEVDAAAFLSDKGDVTARAEAEHDVRITQKLVLQPRVELDFALQDITHARLGSGLASADLGLRLRYGFVPNFAPYIGVSYERAFGDKKGGRRERAPGGCRGIRSAGQLVLAQSHSSGSTLVPLMPPIRISKCRCGPVDMPVEPVLPITSPTSTTSPTSKRRESYSMWA
jgi:copper resistance protein B